MNGTLLQASQWNSTNTSYMLVSNWNATNTSYMLISQWNATNTSYYLASNPLGFYNVTTLPAWNATNTSYALYSDLNNGSYLNYPWNATNTSYLEIKNWNATNTSYMTGENFTLQNQSMKNYVNLNFFSNITNFTGSVSGGGYCTYNAGSGKIDCIQGSGAINESDPFWGANYSTFLTHITFGQVSNGTIWSWVMNGTMATTAYADAQNTSQNNYIAVVNSMKNYVNFQNGSMKNYVDFQNTSNNNYIVFANTTLMQILNNGTYANYAWNATNTSYMTGDNFTIQNTSMKNYVDSQDTSYNTSNNNYIASNNNSNNNYLASNNLSVNNYINSQDT